MMLATDSIIDFDALTRNLGSGEVVAMKVPLPIEEGTPSKCFEGFYQKAGGRTWP